MEDIDVTRKIRPLKTPGTPAPTPPLPAISPPVPVSPLVRSEPSAFSPPPVAAPRVLPPLESHTVRFAASTPPPAVPGHLSPVEPDPITGWLVVMKGAGRGRSLPLGYGINAVGRAEDQRVPVRFGDKKISRRSHVEVSYDGKGRAFYLSPGRGSTLGYLNGQPVLQPSPLKAGDRITLGDTELAFVPFCGEAFDWQQTP